LPNFRGNTAKFGQIWGFPTISGPLDQGAGQTG
jgi:hypothetical protein